MPLTCSSGIKKEMKKKLVNIWNIWADRGGEFMFVEFINFCAKKGLKESYLHQGYHNRMVFLKWEIDPLWTL